MCSALWSTSFQTHSLASIFTLTSPSNFLPPAPDDKLRLETHVPFPEKKNGQLWPGFAVAHPTTCSAIRSEFVPVGCSWPEFSRFEALAHSRCAPPPPGQPRRPRLSPTAARLVHCALTGTVGANIHVEVTWLHEG